MINLFIGKTILITGASSGIGLHLAAKLSNVKCKLILAARRTEIIEAKFLKDIAADVQIEYVDLNDHKSIISFTESVKKTNKNLHTIINNAGFIEVEKITEISLSNWQQCLQINLTAPFIICRELIPSLSENSTIINVSSLAGIGGIKKFEGFAAYTASKMGLGGLTEVLAEELKSKSIRVNAICPGSVDAPMLKKALPGIEAEMTTENVSNAILFYASKLSAPTTGKIIPVTSF